jgi:hypothetical protein
MKGNGNMWWVGDALGVRGYGVINTASGAGQESNETLGAVDTHTTRFLENISPGYLSVTAMVC